MRGFRLTQESRSDGFSGGSVVVGPVGHMFDVGESLKNGDGSIYTEDDTLAEVLRSYPALEPIPQDELPEDPHPVVVLPGGVIAPSTVGGEPAVAGPPTMQTTDASPVGVAPGVEEIVAVHADEPATEEEAIKVGEAVSGLGNQSSQSGQSSAQASGSTQTGTSPTSGRRTLGNSPE